MTMHDRVTSCIAHERLRVEYGLVRKSCMNHARTCKIFFLGRARQPCRSYDTAALYVIRHGRFRGLISRWIHYSNRCTLEMRGKIYIYNNKYGYTGPDAGKFLK